MYSRNVFSNWESFYKYSHCFARGICNKLTVYGTVLQVSDINPLKAIKTAMSRKPPGWEVPWIPTECLPLEDSLKAWVSLHSWSI
jgi:hypothetical protein